MKRLLIATGIVIFIIICIFGTQGICQILPFYYPPFISPYFYPFPSYTIRAPCPCSFFIAPLSGDSILFTLVEDGGSHHYYDKSYGSHGDNGCSHCCTNSCPGTYSSAFDACALVPLSHI